MTLPGTSVGVFEKVHQPSFRVRFVVAVPAAHDVVAVLDPKQVDEALAIWRSLPDGEHAERIGRITSNMQRVILETPLGGERFLEELEDDPLPRIC